MASKNVVFQHVKVLMKNGKIKPATVVSRTNGDDVMVRLTTKGTPFRATTTTRTRKGRAIKFLSEF